MSINYPGAATAALALCLALAATPEAAQAGKYTVLHAFNEDDGDNPLSSLVMDAAGNLYGTTLTGGSNGRGDIFKLAPDRSETVLHSFTGADGLFPEAGVILDKKGNLYGTTFAGGANDAGVVFEFTADGVEKVLYSFCARKRSCADGGGPMAGLIADKDGNLYGTTRDGGAADMGVVFRLSPEGKETVLHNFTGGSDGANPYAPVIADTDGNFYGTTAYGDAGCDPYGCGIVFRLAPDGTETVLHAFQGGTDGAYPYSGLIADKDGNLYGTTSGGGAARSLGVVFRLSPDGAETILHAFAGEPDGYYPLGAPILDSEGNLYGTTSTGGRADFSGGGTIFEIAPDGTVTVLHTFKNHTGKYPKAGVILDKKGNLYGTTFDGGANHVGVVFELKH